MSIEPTIRERRMRLGLSQGQVGALASLAQSYVSRAEYGRGPVTAIKAIEEALWTEERRREMPGIVAEQERIATQEALWNAVPDGPEKQALLAAMLERALDLMFEGDGTQTDAICEWLPKADVHAMFDRWEAEVFPPTAEADQATA